MEHKIVLIQYCNQDESNLQLTHGGEPWEERHDSQKKSFIEQ